ncbi:unnamed protein product [Calicophoron daubneyi]|uniref:adenylate cyclase n=1 Tax=Calicophoron daubneyi TaxID=300641 RepID=A0AAV2SVH2_CALDB
MSTGAGILSAEPGYQNWLVSKPTEIPSTHAENESSLHIPLGLQLSTRRGPEVELYDVAGVHLLESGTSGSSAPPPTDTRHKGSSWLTSLWRKGTKSGQEDLHHGSGVVLANRGTDLKTNDVEDVPLGRLSQANPANDQLYNAPPSSLSSTHMPKPFGRLNFGKSRWPWLFSKHSSDNPLSTRSSCCKRIHRCCLLDTSREWNSRSLEMYAYYKHCFTLLYHRGEANLFLFLLIIVSFSQALYSIFYPLSNTTYSQSIIRPSFFNFLNYGEFAHFLLLCASLILALFGVAFVNWGRCQEDNSSSPSMCEDVEEERDKTGSSPAKKSDETNREQPYRSHLSGLLTAQRFRKRLRSATLLGYLSCSCLAFATLPWLSVYRISQKSDDNDWLQPIAFEYNSSCVHPYLNFHTDASASEIPPLKFALQFSGHSVHPIEVVEPSTTLWVVLWIVVMVHGLFKAEGAYSTYWRYVFTILLCILHLVLANVFYIFYYFDAPLINLELTNRTAPKYEYCPLWLKQTHLWIAKPSWDDRVGIVCRENVASILTFIMAHFIGRMIATWTTHHRYRLFITAGISQAKIKRLEGTEKKLKKLARCLVPASLADDLAHDFVAGYLGWSSPLVIYLRNVSFLSAELVGLSSVGSVVAGCPQPSMASQHFFFFLNDLFNCFDRLAKDEGCYRVRLNSSEYMCIAGYPETRVDHARCCVDLGLAMLKVVSELSEVANAHLELRVAVHTGTAYAAVLGRTRLGFELTGDDIIYVNSIKQAAVRPGRVLTSRSTFNQLPEGFRGEAGPVLAFPDSGSVSAHIANDLMSDVSSQISQTALETYFVQPRQSHMESPLEANRGSSLADIDNNLKTDAARLQLSEVCTENVGNFLNRLASAANMVCHQASGTGESPESVPLDFLFFTSADGADEDEEISKEVRVDLLNTLSTNEFYGPSDSLNSSTCHAEQNNLEQSTHSASADISNSHPHQSLQNHDPSTSELLAMAAVAMARSYGRETETNTTCHNKVVPCQRRAGRLRGKQSMEKDEFPDSAELRTAIVADTSMGTSLATMTTTAMDPSLPVSETECAETVRPIKPFLYQVSWQRISPPGCPTPNRLTLRVSDDERGSPPNCPRCQSGKAYSSLSDTDSQTETTNSRCSGCFHSSGFTNQSEGTGAKVTETAGDSQQAVQILSFSAFVLLPFVLVMGLIHLFTVSNSFVLLVTYVVAFAYLGLQLLVFFLLRRFTRTVRIVRPLPCRILLISSILIVVLASSINLFVCQPVFSFQSVTQSFVDGTNLSTLTSTDSLGRLPHRGGRLLSPDSMNEAQLCPIRGQFALISFLTCLLPAFASAAAMYSSFARHPSIQRPIETDEDDPIRLPAGHLAFRALTSNQLALARLLVSAVPRYVIAALCCPTKTSLLYSNPLSCVGVALIQLDVGPPTVQTSEQPNDRVGSPDTDSGSRRGGSKPAQIADRLRLLNHIIGLIDAVADRQNRSRQHSTDTSGEDDHDQDSLRNQTPLKSRLVKLFVSGSTVGYGVGLLPSGTITNQKSRSEQLSNLISFTEQVLAVCEQINSKALSANGFVHVRVALHAGPVVAGLITKQHPVFTIWGDPVNVCLHLLHESHVPALYRQHLLLATDEVISSIPVGRLSSSSFSGHSLFWRCVDPHSGQIIPSTQARNLPANNASAPGGPVVGKATCLPLHFCSIQAAMSPSCLDSEYANKAACAILNMAKLASSPALVNARRERTITKAQPTVKSRPPENIKKMSFSPTQPGAVLHAAGNQPAGLSPLAQLPTVVGSPNSPVLYPQSIAQVNACPPKIPDHGRTADVNQEQQKHLSVSAPPPPPPPPHQRVYPSAGQPMSPRDLVSVSSGESAWVAAPGAVQANSLNLPTGQNVIEVNKAYTGSVSPGLCSPPIRKFSEPAAAVNRQALRRGVVSQFSSTAHDYSLVNTEDLKPGNIGGGGRVVSQVIERTQPQFIPAHDVNPRRGFVSNGRRYGDYWPDIAPPANPQKRSDELVDRQQPPTTKSNETPQKAAARPRPRDFDDLLQSMLGNVTKAGSLRPVSLSSTDSFLAAERACAVENDHDQPSATQSKYSTKVEKELNTVVENEADKKDEAEDEEDDETDVISHHNPLYTDNEYESMAESQGNLVDAVDLKPNKRGRTGSSCQTSTNTPGQRVTGAEKRSLFQPRDSRDRYVAQPSLPVCNSSARLGMGNDSAPEHTSQPKLALRGGKHGTEPTSVSLGNSQLSALSIMDERLDFPDIQRPPSPGSGYLRDKINQGRTAGGYDSGASFNSARNGLASSGSSTAARTMPKLNGKVGKTPILQQQQPQQQQQRQYNANSPIHPQTVASPALVVTSVMNSVNPQTAQSVRCSDNIFISNSCNNCGQAKTPVEQLQQVCQGAGGGLQVPSRKVPFDASDVDGTDAEYMGTFSLGPVSMAVVPSVAGDDLTSCDEEFGPVGDMDEEDYSIGCPNRNGVAPVPRDFQHGQEKQQRDARPKYNAGYAPQEPVPVVAGGIEAFGGLDLPGDHGLLATRSCMTDSLLANPDLDARESEIGDDLEPELETSDIAAIDRSPFDNAPLHHPAGFTRTANTNGGVTDVMDAPALLEAALLQPPLSSTGCSNGRDLLTLSTNDDISESDADELFAYHGQPGTGFSFQPTNALQAMPQNPNPLWYHSKDLIKYAPDLMNPQFSNSPLRPSLPDVAPVGLPDFGRIQLPPALFYASTNSPQYQPQQRPAEDETVSDYDNLCMASSVVPPHHHHVDVRCTKPVENRINNPTGRKPNLNHWPFSAPGDESDGMSGYNGDVASSVYDTGDDEEEHRGKAKFPKMYSFPTEEHPFALTNYQARKDPAGINRPGRVAGSSIANSNNQQLPAQKPSKIAAEIRRSIYSEPPFEPPVPTVTPTVNYSQVDVKISEVAKTNGDPAIRPDLGLDRVPSNSGSQTSGAEQRSEYDNVGGSRSTTVENTPESIKSKRIDVNRSKRSSVTTAGSPQKTRSSRSASVSKNANELSSGLRGIFDAEIAAQARRISRQFRAMGWLPAPDYSKPADLLLDRKENEEQLIRNDIHNSDTSLVSGESKGGNVHGPGKPHLFLLPVGSQLSNPCSRQTSFRHRIGRQPGFITTSGLDSETVTTVTSRFDDDENVDDESDEENRTDASDLDEDEPLRLVDETLSELGASSFIHIAEQSGKPWDMDEFSAASRLGCLLVRPRSLSATCLLTGASLSAQDAAMAAAIRTSAAGPHSSEELSSDDPDDTADGNEVLGQPDMTEQSQENCSSHLAPSARLCDRQQRGLCRSRSSRARRRRNRVDGHAEDRQPSAQSPGLTRLQRRAARVRSLLPPDLHPFILPGCMSSPSCSSSMTSSAISGAAVPPGLIFLSLTRGREFQQKQHKHNHRFKVSNAYRGFIPRWSSDPELRVQYDILTTPF